MLQCYATMLLEENSPIKNNKTPPQSPKVGVLEFRCSSEGNFHLHCHSSANRHSQLSNVNHAMALLVEGQKKPGLDDFDSNASRGCECGDYQRVEIE